VTNWTRVLVRVLVISLALMGSSQAHSDETPGDPELLNGAAKIAHLEWKSASGQEGQAQALTLVNLRESTSPARAGNADYAVMPEGALEGGGPPPLGDPPIELGSGAWVRTKIGNTITYDADVKCGTKKIGTLHFEYYLWKGNSTSNNDPNNIGGAAMAGGFQLDPESTCVLEDGWIWGFVQTVSATPPGANVWGAAADEWFVDSANRTDPDYPFEQPGYTHGFQDFPWRVLAAPADSWNGELALVCKNLTTKEMKIMGSLLWGFQITAAGDVEEGTLPNFGSPNFWGPPSQNFIDTVLKDWTGVDFSAWSVAAGCCCDPDKIPTLSQWGLISFGLLLLGAMYLTVRRRGSPRG